MPGEPRPSRESLSSEHAELLATKKKLRKMMHARRVVVPERAARAEQIADRLRQLPDYQSAVAVAFYVSVRHEVDTRVLLAEALQQRRFVAVPYCHDDELRLVQIRSLEELVAGRYGIPEPSLAIRSDPVRCVSPNKLELILVPGIAFDTHGNRLGHGAGYYDKLLAAAGKQTRLVGLAYECQIVDELPVEPHDIRLHWVVTEATVYRGRK